MAASPLTECLVYCDGSRTGSGADTYASGLGVVWYRGGVEIPELGRSLPTGSRVHSTDAELSALLTVSRQLLDGSSPFSFRVIRRIRIFTDCDVALRLLREITPSPGAAKALVIRNLVSEAVDRYPHLHVSFEHVPGHFGILGNDAADARAHDAATPEQQPPDAQATLRWLKESATRRMMEDWEKSHLSFLSRSPGRATIWHAHKLSRKPGPLLSLDVPRRVHRRAMQAASGACFHASWWKRAHPRMRGRCVWCKDEDNDLSHTILDCPHFSPARRSIKFYDDLSSLFWSEHGPERLAAFLSHPLEPLSARSFFAGSLQPP